MIKYLLITTLALASTFCVQKQTHNANLNQSMRKTANALVDLAPYVYEDSLFYNSTYRDLIIKRLKVLNKVSHQIDESQIKAMMGDEPLTKQSLKNLKWNFQVALETFEANNLSYSQYLIKHNIGNCFNCHTRTQMGPEYNLFEGTQFIQNVDSPIAKAQLYIATRQFTKAENSLKDFLLSKAVQNYNSLNTYRAIKTYLFVNLKLNNSPQKSLNFLNRLEKINFFPLYISKNFEFWKKSLSNWAKASKNSKLSFKKIESLIFIKNSIAQNYSDTRYVDYLRASTQLHQRLISSDVKSKARIYYLLGVVYTGLGQSEFWELPTNYFESCIINKPKSGLAKNASKNMKSLFIWDFQDREGTLYQLERRRSYKT